MSTPPDLISFDTSTEDVSKNRTLELRKLFDPFFTDETPTPISSVSRNPTLLKPRVPPPLPPRFPIKPSTESDANGTAISKPNNYIAKEDLASLLDSFIVSPSAKSNKPPPLPPNKPNLKSVAQLLVKTKSEEFSTCPNTEPAQPVKRRKPVKQKDLAFVRNSQASTELELFVNTVENLRNQEQDAQNPQSFRYSFASPFDEIISQNLPINETNPSYSNYVVFDAVYGHLVPSFARRISIENGDCFPENLPRKTSIDQVRRIRPQTCKRDETEAATPIHWKNTSRWNIPQIEVRIDIHVGPHAKSYQPLVDGVTSASDLSPNRKRRSDASCPSPVFLVPPRIRLVCDPNSTLVSELMLEALSRDILPLNTDLNVNNYQLRLHGHAELLNPDARLCDCNQVQLCHRLDLPLRLILEPKFHNDNPNSQPLKDGSSEEEFKPQCLLTSSEKEIFDAYEVFQKAVDEVRTILFKANGSGERTSSALPSEIQRVNSALNQSVKAVLFAVCQSIAFTDVQNALGSVQSLLSNVANDAKLSNGQIASSADALVGSIRRNKTSSVNKPTGTQQSRNLSGLALGNDIFHLDLQKLERELCSLEYALLVQISAFLDWRQVGLRVNSDVLEQLSRRSRPQAGVSGFSGRPLGAVLDKLATNTSELIGKREVRSSDTCVEPFLVGLIAVHRVPQRKLFHELALDDSGRQNSSPQRMATSPDYRTDTNFHVLLTLTYAGRRLGLCYPLDPDSQHNAHRTVGQALSRDSFLSDPGRSQRVQAGLLNSIHFDQWFKFPAFSINQLPRETLLSLSLFSCKHQPGENPLDGTLIGWVNIPLFDANGILRQNTIVAGLWSPSELPQDYRPGWSQPNRSNDCAIVQICLPEYRFEIEFPVIQPDATDGLNAQKTNASLVSEANKAISQAQCSIFMHSINPDLSARAAMRCLALYSEAASASHRSGKKNSSHVPLPCLRLGALNPVSSGDQHTTASGSPTSTSDPISYTWSNPPGVAVEVLWNLRWHLYEQPSALVALLTSVLVVWPQETRGVESPRSTQWSWVTLLRAVYSLLVEFPPTSPGLALRLLAPDVADQAIRHWAVQSLAVLPPDILIQYLPQVLEALNFDLYLDYSGLASLLLQRSSSSMRFANALYWHLITGLCASTVSSPSTSYSSPANEWRSRRFLYMKAALMYLSSPRIRNAWRRQDEAVTRLTNAALGVKRAKGDDATTRDLVLRNHMQSFMQWLDADSRQSSMLFDPSTTSSGEVLPDPVEKVPPLIVLDEQSSEQPTKENSIQSPPKQEKEQSNSTPSDYRDSPSVSLYDVGLRMPYNPGLLAHRLDTNACTYFSSFTRPLLLVFHALDTEAEPIRMMFKIGDDLRKDSLITQFTFLMDRIWLDAGLDLRMIHFRIVPTGDKQGLIEFVSECSPLRKIQQQGGGLTGPFKESVITMWLQSQNSTQLDYIRSLDNFLRSLAGCCVATYVLGVGDRHNDNIMVCFSGHLFHVDFAKAFGDAQTCAGIKRDRVPFVLTHDMYHVLHAYSKELNEASSASVSSPTSSSSRQHRGSREGVQLFIDYCCQAYNLLRKHAYSLIFILEMSLSMNIPGVTRDSVRYMMSTLQLELSEQEASQHFTRLIRKTLSSRAPAFNFFVHGLAQAKQSSSKSGESSGPGGNSITPTNSVPEMGTHMRNARPIYQSSNRRGSLSPGQLFSFVPKRFTVSERGDIDAVIVEAAVKLRGSDKHADHYFPMSVWRKDCRIPTRVYRRISDLLELCSVVQYAFSESADLTNLPLLLGSLTANHVTSIRTQNSVQELIDYILEADKKIRKSEPICVFFHSLLFDEKFAAKEAQNLSNEAQFTFWGPSPPRDSPSKETTPAALVHADSYDHFRVSDQSAAIQLQLQLSESAQRLDILVKHGRALLIPGTNEVPDVYVKIYLLLAGRRDKSTKRRTAVIRRSSSPTFNTTFSYDLTPNNLRSGLLEVSAWHAVNLGENFSLGQTHIELRTLRPGCCITKWYTLLHDPTIA